MKRFRFGWPNHGERERYLQGNEGLERIGERPGLVKGAFQFAGEDFGVVARGFRLL
jgi:hypothetical protein